MADSMVFASAVSTEPRADAASAEAAARIKTTLRGGTPDLVLVFASPHFVDDAPSIHDTIRRELDPRVLTGCHGEGVIGADREIEQSPAVSIVAARIPGGELSPLTLRAADLHKMLGRGGSLPNGEALPNTASLFVMIADPFTTAMNELLSAFNASFPGTPIIGGMASAARSPGGNVLFANDGIQKDGAVVVGISGSVNTDVIVSQGCRPVGPVFEIDDSRDNVILGLGGKPPLQQLEIIVGELTNEERDLLRNGLFIGRAVDPKKEILGRGDFLVRGVVGVDPRSGSITIGDFVDTGDVVQFHLRDAATAQEDLEMMLTPHGLFGAPGGALLFSCNGRGTRLYDHPNGDVSVIQRFFPGLNLAGFFCAGEIGPIGGRNFVHGHTASLVLFRPAQPRRASTPEP
ncbi:MAG: FIST N-terminal domain-containing protein [bacterium]